MIILLFVVLMLLPIGSHAQHSAFKATRLTVADGLSDNMVLCALQDRYGFVWFGTRNGLNRYDGYHITTFFHNRENPHSLSDAPVHSLYEDSRGRLWAGTGEGGLNLFDPVTERFTHYGYDPDNPHSILPGVIISICEDAEGCLWLVTNNTQQGVQKFDPERSVCIRYRYHPNDPYSISGDAVTGICRDSSGNIWLATKYHGINRYDPSREGFINYRTVPEYHFAGPSPFRIFASSDGGLWLADTMATISKLYVHGNHITRVSLPLNRHPDTYDNTVNSIVEGAGNLLWISTQGAGVYIVDWAVRTFRQVVNTTADPYGLASNQVFMLYSDHFGDMWICTDVGVQRFHRRTHYLQHFCNSPLDPSSIAFPKVRSLLGDGRGGLLIGTGGNGLNVSKGGKMYHYTNSYMPVDILSNTVNILYRTQDSRLWAGTNNGLYTVDPATGTFTRSRYPVFGTRIWSVYEDESGIVWVGTLFNGLTRIDRHTGRTKYYFDGMITQRGRTPVSAHVIYGDRHRNLWIGTNNGLYRMDRQTDTPVRCAWYSPESFSLSHDHIWYIHEAHNGKLWLGTAGGGLNLFDPAAGTCVRYRLEHGLPSNIICGILEDDHGNLWVSTNTGLFRFTPSTGKVVIYRIEDGMYMDEFHFKTCFRDSNGVMYFGGTGGFVRFHPDSLAIETRPRNLVFTSFKVFDHRLALDSALIFKKQVVLPHSSNYFSVEFISLDFAGAHHHRYRYKLDGYDKQWQQTDGSRPFAGYTNVPPGDYILRVEVADAAGNWSGTASTLNICIPPAWWQTLWFRGTMAFCLALSVAGSLRWYMGSVRRRSTMERKLVEFQLQALQAQMNPHFIFNSLNSIYYYIMSREDDKAQTYLCLFSMLLRMILDYSSRTFISIGREVEILEMYLELEAMRFSQRFGYQIAVAPEIDTEQQMIPALLLQPYVENAVKHGLLPKERDCLLTIEFQREGDRIVCRITDNGIGRNLAQHHREQSQLPHISRGMALSKERLGNLSELHGKLYGVEVQDLTAADGEALGTMIVLTFPAEVEGYAVEALLDSEM